MIYIQWVLALSVSVSAFGQTNTVQNNEIREYRSLQEMFREIPLELQPHKKLSENNPVLRDKLYTWFKENLVGRRLTLRQREVIKLDEHNLTVAGDSPFTLGGGTYKTPGIECHLSSPSSSAAYKLLQKQGKMPEDLPYEQYRAQQELKHEKVLNLLAKLTLSGKKDGQVTRQGSKVNVTGTITSISTGYDLSLRKPPSYLEIYLDLSDVEVTQ